MTIKLFAFALVLLAGPAGAEPGCITNGQGGVECHHDGWISVVAPDRSYGFSQPEIGQVLPAPEQGERGCLYRADGKMDCEGVISTVPYYGSTSGATSTNANLLPVQPPPTPHCEDGWVMVEVASVKIGPATLATVKKCAPAGDLKDPK